MSGTDTEFRVVVTGGRDFNRSEPGTINVADRTLFHGEMRALLAVHGSNLSLAQGFCPTGADAFAREWARNVSIPMRDYRPNWERDGKAAGPIRNKRMLEDFRPHLVLAFPGGRGTADCCRRAEAMGITVRRVGP